MRSFLAIPLPADTVDALVRVQGSIPFGRAVPPENMHLTLAFLGAAGLPALEILNDLLDSTPLPIAEIRFTGLGTFAEIERGLAFAEVAPNPPLTSLHSKIAHAARQAGIDLPRRRFRPHVTLMRANKQPKGPARDRLADALGQSIFAPSFTATKLNLYRSDLSATGARYEVMAQYPLSP